ncbi:unnamed protein product [Linum trigynum]|uniref:Uncharacterized protein n=1 Tax=Linum trigynum TaxID=586398 RepID=A0AAV2ED21_9ROSI
MVGEQSKRRRATLYKVAQEEKQCDSAASQGRKTRLLRRWFPPRKVHWWLFTVHGWPGEAVEERQEGDRLEVEQRVTEFEESLKFRAVMGCRPVGPLFV